MLVRQQFDSDIVALKQTMREMGETSRKMVAWSVQALQEQKLEIVDRVLAEDDVVDEANLKVEQECMRLVIQQQPVAHDLRVIGMIYQSATELERIADHAVDIAKAARKIKNAGGPGIQVDVPALASKVDGMFASVLEAFSTNSSAAARAAIAADDEVDNLFHVQRAHLLEEMQKSPADSVVASYLMFIIQFLERIGDRIVNFAERILYAEEGPNAGI